jgi:hypothetical protein
MKQRVRFGIMTAHALIRGSGLADPDGVDGYGVVLVDQAVFDTPEDAEEWAEFDRACGGDGTGPVRALLEELEILEGLVPGPDQPPLFGGET